MRHVRRLRRLVGFVRVDLGAGEGRTVDIGLAADAMALLDDDEVWRVVPGTYVISCGGSATDPGMLRATLVLT